VNPRVLPYNELIKLFLFWCICFAFVCRGERGGGTREIFSSMRSERKGVRVRGYRKV
jgi:hypothetical protein